MNKDWRGILQIDEIKHIRNGKVIWEKFNLKNILHLQGEEYFLKILFSSSITKPTNYYFGLDNRDTISVSDELTDLYNEPQTHNYSRQVASSSTDWTFVSTTVYSEAKSPVLTFGASGGSWGPVCNLFMTMQDQSEDPTTGYLISTVYLGENITVLDGDSISMRMGVKLQDGSLL